MVIELTNDIEKNSPNNGYLNPETINIPFKSKLNVRLTDSMKDR